MCSKNWVWKLGKSSLLRNLDKTLISEQDERQEKEKEKEKQKWVAELKAPELYNRVVRINVSCNRGIVV